MSALKRVLTPLALLVALCATAAPASAVSTVDYPECEDTQVAIEFSDDVVVSGTDLTVSARGFSGAQTPPGTLTITVFGETYVQPSNEFSRVVTAPVVNQSTEFTATARFVPDNGCPAPGSANASVAATNYRSSQNSTVVTVVPLGTDLTRDNPDNNGLSGLLPNTGGTAWWLLVAGGALLLVGSGVLIATSRRSKNPV